MQNDNLFKINIVDKKCGKLYNLCITLCNLFWIFHNCLVILQRICHSW